MKEYRAIYKCRLCGEEIFGRTIRGTDKAEIQLKNSCAFSTEFFNPKTAHREKRGIKHICKDGSLGFAEFLGFRKVDK